MTDLSHIFPFNNHSDGGDLPHKDTGGVRHLNKELSENNRALYNSWWQEQIFQFGTEIEYFQSQYSLDTHDSLYGEEPTAAYKSPVKMVVAFELNESAIVLSKFGLLGDDEITGYISIDAFWHSFSEPGNPKPEPKSGDVFKLTEYGSLDRIGGRDGKVFEITDRVEQDISKINPLIGHYIWLIKAKRHDYSFEPGLSPEGASNQVFDDLHSGGEQSDRKIYPPTSTNRSKKVFDYNDYYESDDDVYGGYDDPVDPPLPPEPVDIPGCTVPGAINYNSQATINDGSCEYDPDDIPGCTVPGAINYNSQATINDGSCEYDPDDIPGCTVPGAINFHPQTTINDGSCE